MSHFQFQPKHSVFLAFLLIVGTNVWYYTFDLPEPEFIPRTPIAFVIQKTGEAARREVGKAYWQHLSLGQGVFAGEQIQTRGEVVVLSLHEGATLEVAPFTLLSFSDGRGRPRPDLLIEKGRITLKSKDVVNLQVSASAQTKVLFLSGEAQIWTEDNQTFVEVQSGQSVARGNEFHRILKKGESGRLTSTQFFAETKKLRIVSPSNRKLHTLSPTQRLQIRWQPLGSSYDRLSFYWGKNSKSLRKTTFKITPQQESLFVPMISGDWYWKVTASSSAKNSTSKESSLSFSRFKEIDPPIALAPHKTFIERGEFGETIVNFYIENPGGLENLALEISTDPSFRARVHRESLEGEVRKKVKIGESGNVYWRVVGRLHQHEDTIQSATSNFAILPNKPSDMSWALEKGYLIDWEVEHEAQKQLAKSFSLKDRTLRLNLAKVPSDVSRVRYRFMPSGEASNSSEWQSTTGSTVSLPVPQAGFYHLQMIAYDESKRKTRLIRNDFLYLTIPQRDLASVQ